MNELGALAAAFGFGVASAIIPVLNVEAYAVVNAVVFGKPMMAGIVVALAIGTTIGKTAVFEGARVGKQVVKSKRAKIRTTPPRRAPRWIARSSTLLMSWLDKPLLGGVTVLVSALGGIPPLLAVALVAGTSKQHVVLFVLAVFVGRTLRFGAIAGGVAIAGDL